MRRLDSVKGAVQTIDFPDYGCLQVHRLTVHRLSTKVSYHYGSVRQRVGYIQLHSLNCGKVFVVLLQDTLPSTGPSRITAL